MRAVGRIAVVIASVVQHNKYFTSTNEICLAKYIILEVLDARDLNVFTEYRSTRANPDNLSPSRFWTNQQKQDAGAETQLRTG